MPKKTPELVIPPQERAFLVGASFRDDNNLLSIEDSLAELALLAETAGLNVVGELSQHLNRPNAETYIGSGKVNELKILVEETLSEVVIFDNELSPRHLRELEMRFGPKVKVIDRTSLILDIFAQHARTREGKLQVELAQYEYRLPRLTRAWTHLARQTGGGGGRTGNSGGVGLRGPGETQLEVDRREIRKRISTLKKEIEKISAHRARHRLNRKRTSIPVIALVGYTNAGKSTLLNRLSSANVFVANKLFATLDPTTRKVNLRGENKVLFTDTVGFIQKLPTQLIAAFRATLEEISEADILLHVIDASHPNAISHGEAVKQTLIDLNAENIPIITVLNKIDNIVAEDQLPILHNHFINAVPISALTGKGIEELLNFINSELFDTYLPIQVLLPYKEGQLTSLFHDQGHITHTVHERRGVIINGLIPGRLAKYFIPYSLTEKIDFPEE